MAMTGYVINLVILSNKFTFVRYTDIGYKDFDIQSVILVFNGILHTIGYGNGNVFSFISILNGSALIIFALMLFCIFSGVSRKFETTDINQFLSLYVLCAFMIFTLLYAFTDMSYQDRYNIPILVFSIPVITLNLSEIRLNKNVKKSVCIFILSVVYIGGIYKFNSRKNIDTTFYAREITQYLTDHNVLKGYATFWNANLLTELSNGRIEVWTHPPGAVETIWKDTDAVYKWLQYVDHANCKPDGEIFVIQTIEEYESTAQYTTMKPENAVFHNDRYFLFVFKNYNEMQNSVIRK